MDASINVAATLTLGDLELDVDVVIEGDPLGELPPRITLNGENLRLSEEQTEQVQQEFAGHYKQESIEA